MWYMYDENKAVIGEGYVVSNDSFDPSKLSSSSVDEEEHKIDDYRSTMPSKPAHYNSDQDISSDSGNGFENLARD
jgi:hypothetical protein